MQSTTGVEDSLIEIESNSFMMSNRNRPICTKICANLISMNPKIVHTNLDTDRTTPTRHYIKFNSISIKPLLIP